MAKKVSTGNTTLKGTLQQCFKEAKMEVIEDYIALLDKLAIEGKCGLDPENLLFIQDYEVEALEFWKLYSDWKSLIKNEVSFHDDEYRVAAGIRRRMRGDDQSVFFLPSGGYAIFSC